MAPTNKDVEIIIKTRYSWVEMRTVEYPLRITDEDEVDPNPMQVDSMMIIDEVYQHTGKRITIPYKPKSQIKRQKSKWEIADEEKWGRPSEGEIEARNNMY